MSSDLTTAMQLLNITVPRLGLMTPGLLDTITSGLDMMIVSELEINNTKSK